MHMDILGAIVVVLCGGRFRIPPTGGCRECGLPDVLSNLSPFPFHLPPTQITQTPLETFVQDGHTNCVQVEVVQEPKMC